MGTQSTRSMVSEAKFILTSLILILNFKFKHDRLCFGKNQDQVLLSMQQKLDDLCNQVNPVKDQSGTENDMALRKNADLADSGGFGQEKIKFVDCGCWLCDEHLDLISRLEVNILNSLLSLRNYELRIPFWFPFSKVRPRQNPRAGQRFCNTKCHLWTKQSKRSVECLICLIGLPVSHLLLIYRSVQYFTNFLCFSRYPYEFRIL